MATAQLSTNQRLALEVIPLSRLCWTDGHRGAIYGHMVLYLHGVQMVTQSGLQVLQVGGSSGVGLSCNKILKNRRFVAIPGRDIFLGLSRQSPEELVELVESRGWVDGVEVRGLHTLNSRPVERWGALGGMVGTDFGLSLARNALSLTMPLHGKQMELLVDDLNQQNAYCAIKGSPGNYWDFHRDNCTHFVQRALRTVGLLPEKRFRQKHDKGNVRRFFKTVDVPGNLFCDLVDHCFDSVDLWRVANDASARYLLTRFGRLPLAMGMHLSQLDQKPGGDKWWVPAPEICTLERAFLPTRFSPYIWPSTKTWPKWRRYQGERLRRIYDLPKPYFDAQSSTDVILKRYQDALSGTSCNGDVRGLHRLWCQAISDELSVLQTAQLQSERSPSL